MAVVQPVSMPAVSTLTFGKANMLTRWMSFFTWPGVEDATQVPWTTGHGKRFCSSTATPFKAQFICVTPPQ